MSARILIVDDTPLNVKLLSAKLAHEYYSILTAENGAEALKIVAKEKPDLILLDVMMPEMDGFEMCRRLKADPATAYIPVIMITALSDVADRVRGLAAGADDFLGKPINDLALMARIRSTLRMKILMDEWRLHEATAQQLSPSPSVASVDPFNVRNSRILIVDDNAVDEEFVRQALAPISAHVASVHSITDAETILADGSYDLVLANLDLRDENGLTICPRLRTNPVTRHLPILLLANPTAVERVAKGLDLGANDYLLRPFDTHELFARARTQLRHKLNYDRLRNGLQQNILLALVDPLTGAFNRRYLDAHLPRFLQHAAEGKKSLAVQMLDIDHFKQVNDRYGHIAGDAVLKEIAQRISNAIRPSDFVVRMGGEEFAVIMPETSLQNASKIADRLRLKVSGAPISIPGSDEGLKVTVTLSVGIAETRPESEGTPNRVFERADEALYKAKENGRNQVCASESITS